MNENSIDNEAEEEKNDCDSPSSIQERITTFRSAIKEIQEAIQARKDLNKKFKEQIEQEIKNTLAYLDTMQPPWRIGFEIQYEFLRTSLHKSLTSRRRELRTEDLRFWEDMLALMKEKRRFIMEYDSLRHTKNRMNL